MEIKKWITIFLPFIFNIWSFIAAQQLSVDILPLGGQLPSNSVQRIFQDREGFMWFGTREGLSRYDGYRVLTFRSGKTTPNLLTDNQITSITDSWERVLIGTKKGLNILNKKTYEIYHVDNEELKGLDEQKLPSAIGYTNIPPDMENYIRNDLYGDGVSGQYYVDEITVSTILSPDYYRNEIAA